MLLLSAVCIHMYTYPPAHTMHTACVIITPHCRLHGKKTSVVMSVVSIEKSQMTLNWSLTALLRQVNSITASGTAPGGIHICRLLTIALMHMQHQSSFLIMQCTYFTFLRKYLEESLQMKQTVKCYVVAMCTSNFV